MSIDNDKLPPLVQFPHFFFSQITIILKLTQCNEVLLKELPIGLLALKIEEFGALESLSEVMVDSNGYLHTQLYFRNLERL